VQTIWVYLVLVLMSASESNSSDVATQMTLVNDDMKHCGYEVNTLTECR
jgi:hypothetical protein